MYGTQWILLFIAAPFVLIGVTSLLERFTRFPPELSRRLVQRCLLLSGVCCLWAGAEMIESGWTSPLEGSDLPAHAGSVAARGRGAGSVFLLAILWWPWVTAAAGTVFLLMAASTWIERGFDRLKNAWRRFSAPRDAVRDVADAVLRHEDRPAVRPMSDVPSRAALIAGARATVRIDEVDRIVQGYSATLQRPDVTLGLNATDERLLPHPKDRVRAALILAIEQSGDAAMQDALGAAYLLLADFQHGVGQLPAALISANLQHDRARKSAELAALTVRA